MEKIESKGENNVIKMFLKVGMRGLNPVSKRVGVCTCFRVVEHRYVQRTKPTYKPIYIYTQVKLFYIFFANN